MSGDRVPVFDDCVLKIGRYRPENGDTVRVMRRLAGRVPVPEVLCHERTGDGEYLLMTRVRGRMACDAYFPERLAEGLELLWSVDTAGCPRERNPDREPEEAARRVEKGLADPERAEPENFGPGGFRGPEALPAWLEANRPDCDTVLSHGDYCLPNVFIDGCGISGFIDPGDTGTGDRRRDIALCRRSLKHNFDGTHGAARPGFDPDVLFDALGIRPDREKLRYYLLPDELF